MKKVRIALVAMVVLAAVGLAGCAKKESAADVAKAADSGEWKWTRKVTLVCPWGVGGGSDGTLRPLQPVLQSVLGVPVEIVNVEGAGGANGVIFASKQPADGYTYVLTTQSHIMLDLQKILPFDFRKDFEPVAKLVHSTNMLIGSKKAAAGKYNDFQELLTYIKAHPGELSCGMLTATGLDSVALKQTLAGGLGVSMIEVDKYVKTVPYGSGAEQASAMVGGHLGLGIAGAEEIKGLVESGDIVPYVTICEARTSTSPDTPTTVELGIDSTAGGWRAIYARTGTPKEAEEAMAKAIKQAWDSPEFQKFWIEAGYNNRSGYTVGSEHAVLVAKEYEQYGQYLKDIGILK